MPPEPSTEVVLAAPGSGAIIAAEQPEEILAKAQQIAAPLKNLIEQAGLAKNLGGQRKHVEVGGWQAAGAMLGALGGQALHAETVWTRPVAEAEGAEPSEFGSSWEACVEIRTASGVVVGRAEAMCGRAERTWKTRDDYAPSNPARVNPLLRGPVQPAAPSAAGHTGNAGARTGGPTRASNPDPTHHRDAA